MVAGLKGVNREIESVNSFDAPDVTSWLKPRELVLTTGYVFQNKPQQLEQLVNELAQKQCAGLAIKLNVPQTVISIANNMHLPILQIPSQLSLSDIMSPVLREIVTRQNHQREINDDTPSTIRIFSENPIHKHIELIESKAIDLQKDVGCICVVVEISLAGHQEYHFSTIKQISQTIESIIRNADFDNIVEIIGDTLVIIFQNQNSVGTTEIYGMTAYLAQQIISTLSLQIPELPCVIGIGNYHEGKNRLTKSYEQSVKSIEVGKRLGSEKAVYCFNELEPLILLQYAPTTLLADFVSSNLRPLLEHDTLADTDLVNTLEVFLQSNLGPSEAARRMNVHRNTIHSRIKSIKEILNTDLSSDKNLFNLQLALHARHLLK